MGDDVEMKTNDEIIVEETKEEEEEKLLPNGHALIYEKEIEDKKIIKESHTVRKKNNHLLETKDVEEDEQAISNFNKEWEQLLNTENTSKQAIENGEASNKNTEN